MLLVFAVKSLAAFGGGSTLVQFVVSARDGTETKSFNRFGVVQHQPTLLFLSA